MVATGYLLSLVPSGVLAGTVVGSVAAAAVTVYGIVSCLWFTGLVNSFRCSEFQIQNMDYRTVIFNVGNYSHTVCNNCKACWEAMGR